VGLIPVDSRIRENDENRSVTFYAFVNNVLRKTPGRNRMTANSPEQIDFTFNNQNLCREESITDLKAGSIRCLRPIKPDGTKDESRQSIFVGHAQLQSPQGLVPLQAPLQATTLEQAIDEFPGAMEKALKEMVEREKKMQAQQQAEKKEDESRIIMPGK